MTARRLRQLTAGFGIAVIALLAVPGTSWADAPIGAPIGAATPPMPTAATLGSVVTLPI